VRKLTEDEDYRLGRAFQPLSAGERRRLYDEAWKMVDADPVCLVCGRRFKSRQGLLVHQGKAGHFGAVYDLVDYFLAKMLGVVEEEE